MGQEIEPKDEFMQQPGDFFISNDKVHVLAWVRRGFTPADSECEDYGAICGVLSQSWAMPAQGIENAKFVISLEEGEERGAKRCEICLPETASREIPGKERLPPPPELIVILQDLCPQTETLGAIEERSAEVKKQAADILTDYGEIHYSGDPGEDPHLSNLRGLFRYRATPPVKVIIEGREMSLDLAEVFRYDHVIEHQVLDTIAVRVGAWDLSAERQELFRIEREDYIYTMCRKRISGAWPTERDTRWDTSLRATLREIHTLSKILTFVKSSFSGQRQSSDSPAGF